jgi:hypothetical protein
MSPDRLPAPLYRYGPARGQSGSYLTGRERFAAAGYLDIGIDQYALPQDG